MSIICEDCGFETPFVKMCEHNHNKCNACCVLPIPNTMRKDSRVEIFIMDKKCTFCDNQTRVCFIVKGFPIKLCWECAGILKGLIKDKEAEQK